MQIVEEEGDFVGTDVRLVSAGDQTKMILFCGEGEPEGPITATFTLHDDVAVFHPTETICGETIELKIVPNGLEIRVDGGDWELVPKHKNFIREERCK